MRGIRNIEGAAPGAVQAGRCRLPHRQAPRHSGKRRHSPRIRGLTRRGYTIVLSRAASEPCVKTGRYSMDSANVTQLLRAAASGQRSDVDALMAAIYDDLRRLAVGQMRSERDDHTLQPTALVHEAYLKLIDQRFTEWKDRVHFFAVASRIIRRILVDHAREKLAAKRGGNNERVLLDEIELAAPSDRVDLVTLDDALSELAGIDAIQAQIVEMRYFGGLAIEEIAEALDIGKRSVDRHWQTAKAWLCFRLESDRPRAIDE
jgi:RNA polymerase sigma-70 factor (ECF subfamily)